MFYRVEGWLRVQVQGYPKIASLLTENISGIRFNSLSFEKIHSYPSIISLLRMMVQSTNILSSTQRNVII